MYYTKVSVLLHMAYILENMEAIEILVHKEMVLGPSTDGGYWLIGLSKKLLNPVCIWPFSGIKWGTNKVLKQTIQLAKQNKINYQLLRIYTMLRIERMIL